MLRTSASCASFVLSSPGRGNDDIFGKGKRDRLYGDSGADRVFGNTGNDYVFGGMFS